MSTIHRCMIVTAVQQAFAKWVCAELAGTSGAGMFERGLSPTGEEPATHYISTGPISAAFAGALADPDVLFAACKTKGLDVTLAQCVELLAASDMSEDEPFDALARLELRLVRWATAP